MAILHHHICTGQSLAAGGGGTPSDVAGAQANPNFIHRFNLDGELVPMELPEEGAFGGYTRPMRSFVDATWPGGSYHTVANTHAQGGAKYVAIKKGTGVYSEAIDTLEAGIAVNSDYSVVVESLHIIHGEADNNETSRAEYEADLHEWLSDYDADCKAATGQTEDVIGFLCQLPWAGGPGGTVQLAQIDAWQNNPNLYLVGAKYQLPDADGIHLTQAGYYYLGELHARAYNSVRDTGDWMPLWPSRIIAVGTTLDIDFDVPTPPIVIDTTTIASQTARGFNVSDSVGTVTVSAVATRGDTGLRLTLARALVGTSPTLKYGLSGYGNIRDSDPYTSELDGTALRNWLPYFSEPITVAFRAPTNVIRPQAFAS